MTYELAKELKDAGFPQNHDGRKTAVNADNTDYVFDPTLEELIEACTEIGQIGLDFYGKGKWIARIGYYVESTSEQKLQGYPQMAEHCRVEASTSTEAVARLWLALHAKQN